MVDDLSFDRRNDAGISRRTFLAICGGFALESEARSEIGSESSIATLTPYNLRCEYRTEALGVDVQYPRLSWFLSGGSPNECQTAYQIVVTSSLVGLNSKENVLWNSGQVDSSSSGPVVYQGKTLRSREQCFWAVRVWDSNGKLSNWSEPSLWTIGLLLEDDWSAQWISDPVLADPNNRPRIPIYCYRSQIAHSENEMKWIIVDLGDETLIDGVRLAPARDQAENWDFRTVMYPARFKLETAFAPDFSDAALVIDRTKSDVLAPRQPVGQTEVYRFPERSARFVRLTVTKLSHWDGNDYALALARVQVFLGDTDKAEHCTLTSSDSIETKEWSVRYLTDPDNAVAIAPAPDILKPNMGGVDSVSRVPMLRRRFESRGSVKRATLYCAARGFYEIWINGKRVGTDLLSGGYTQYNLRVQYQAYDVTSSICEGPNVLGALLGYGWYAGHMNLSGNEYFSGFFPQLLVQLEVEYADGRQLLVASDQEWKSTLDGPFRWGDILDGFGYDCNKIIHGWSKASFKDTAWRPVTVIPLDGTPIVWQRTQPIQRTAEIQPVAVHEVSPNVYVLDMGHEFAGYCRVIADEPAGTMVKLRYTEERTADGNIDTSSLMGIIVEDDYRMSGDGQQELEPIFTWHGFRFVEVRGLSSAPTGKTITGIEIRSRLPLAGHFNCSNPLFNRLMEASRQTQQNLLFDVPAGCAGRSERLAWTGDIRPCVQTALFHFDSVAFFEKYIADLRADQTSDGRYTDICPHGCLEGTDVCVGSPGWADVGVSMPWQIYINTGDERVLEQHYASAKRWVDFILMNNPDLIWENNLGMSWGDWLSAGPATPLTVGSTAFFANNADILSRMAAILGKDADSLVYKSLFEKIRQAFSKKFVAPNGVIAGSSNGSRTDAQGSYALALHFGLLDKPLNDLAVQRLVELIALNNGHTTTGFWSSIELLLSLTANGHHDVASKMMNLTDYPSWGHMVSGDGSTCWESFDADKSGLSLNHWTHSAIGEWLWRHIAGIEPDPEAPGYRRFTVWPRPTAEVTSCTATYESPRGMIGVSWKNSDRSFTMTVTVPTNTSASIRLPGAARGSLLANGKFVSKASGVKGVEEVGGDVIVTASGGIYRFESSLPA